MTAYLSINGEPVWIVLGFYCPAFQVLNYFYDTEHFNSMYDFCVLDYWG